jgi:hypothetical protein
MTDPTMWPSSLFFPATPYTANAKNHKNIAEITNREFPQFLGPCHQPQFFPFTTTGMKISSKKYDAMPVVLTGHGSWNAQAPH